MGLQRTLERQKKREQKKNNVKYYMSHSDFERLFAEKKEELRQAILEDSIINLSYIFAFAMYEELGIGQKRCKKVMDRFCKDALAMDSGHLKIYDIKRFLEGKNIRFK